MSREMKTFRRAVILPLTEEILNTHAGLLKIFHYRVLGHVCPSENSSGCRCFHFTLNNSVPSLRKSGKHQTIYGESIT